MAEVHVGDGGLLNPLELEPNARKGRLGEVTVELIAVAAGFLVSRTNPDRDGTDLSIKSKNSPFPCLDFQVKCTHTNDDSPLHISYSLSRQQYDLLRAESLAPRYLAVLVVPEIPSHWLRQNAMKITVRKCCYWMRMSGLPEVPNESSVTVYLLRTNLLTGESLSALMRQARERNIRR